MTVTGKVVKVETKLNHGFERFTDKYVNLFASVTTLFFAIAIILILAAIVIVIVQLLSSVIKLFS